MFAGAVVAVPLAQPLEASAVPDAEPGTAELAVVAAVAAALSTVLAADLATVVVEALLVQYCCSCGGDGHTPCIAGTAPGIG